MFYFQCEMDRYMIPKIDWSAILVEKEESDQPVGAVVVSALIFELSMTRNVFFCKFC